MDVRRNTILCVTFPLLLAGCGLTGPCDHTRGVVLYATVDASDVRLVDQTDPLSMVTFWEHQRDGFRRDASWSILSQRLRGTATQVHLHEGSAVSAGGALLYSYPIENGRKDIQPPGQPGVLIDQITSGSVVGYGDGPPGSWYGGTVPIEQLMQKLYLGPTYLDIHTDSVPAGEFRAQLGTPLFFQPLDDPSKWQPVYCD